MTYDEAIALVADELRDKEAWPDTSAKETEQLNLLYNAALAVGREVPLGRLPLTTSAALTAATAKGDVNRYDLNENGVDIFDLRYSEDTGVLDMGISHLIFDDEVYPPEQSIGRASILAIGNNSMHSEDILFALDYPNDQILAVGEASLKLYYAKKPAKPAGTGEDFPLAEDTDAQRAVHIVAAHVAGVTIRDPAQAQFQALLQQTYAS